jgi:hypothetical protein
MVVFATTMLLVAALACDLPQASPPAAPPDTVTPYVPGGEATEPPTAAPTVAPTAAVVDTPSSGGGGAGANLVITNVTLSNSTPGFDEWVTVDVTVENQGGADAAGYQLVVIPHYGWGPPNPAGFEDLPTLAPGATHTATITPGLLYSDAGTLTVRVLVTDDWYSLGNPDSTGTAGDIWDESITVVAPPTASGANVVITDVTLNTNTPAAGGWVTVDVTVQNRGGAPAVSYELVLIPHYGWGPPNPAGFEELPTLAPGATHTSTFTPGVLYTDAGTFTLRVLVTDDWLALGNPDSTGTAGDVWDETITVGGG